MNEVQHDTPDSPVHQSLVWRRNCPYLYSMLYVSELDWPSLTVDWQPSHHVPTSIQDQENVYNMLLGTQTNNEQNYIILAKVRIPNQSYLRKKYENDPPNKNQTVKKNDELMPEKILIQGRIAHDGEVNRVRHSPHPKTMLIASRTPAGQVHIFSTKSLKKDDKVNPDFRLSGHDTEGYALQWNPNREYHIISGSYGGQIALWDINKKEQKKNVVTPLCNFNSFHEKEVEDVSYNKFHDSIFISCDDAGRTAFWDIRSHSKAPVHSIHCHDGVQYGAQFSYASEFIFASCGSDSLVKVWDIRNSSQSLFECSDLKGEQITQVQWSREDPSTLWSVGGSRATLWDMPSQQAKFMHSGSREVENQQLGSRINQLSVNINQPDVVAVVDSNNEIQVFQPNENCKL